MIIFLLSAEQKYHHSMMLLTPCFTVKWCVQGKRTVLVFGFIRRRNLIQHVWCVTLLTTNSTSSSWVLDFCLYLFAAHSLSYILACQDIYLFAVFVLLDFIVLIAVVLLSLNWNFLDFLFISLFIFYLPPACHFHSFKAAFCRLFSSAYIFSQLLPFASDLSVWLLFQFHLSVSV